MLSFHSFSHWKLFDHTPIPLIYSNTLYKVSLLKIARKLLSIKLLSCFLQLCLSLPPTLSTWLIYLFTLVKARLWVLLGTLFIACLFSSYHNEAFYLDLIFHCSIMARCNDRRILQLVSYSKEDKIMPSGLYDNLKSNAHHNQRLQPADVQL